MHLRNDRGFAMFTVVGVMMVIAIASAAAFAAVDGDREATARNVDDKTAYAAANAGIENYAYQLSANGDLWKYCSSPPSSTGVQFGSWVAIPGTVSTKVPQYRLENIPANGYPGCRSDRMDSVFDRRTGTMRIRAVGRAYAGGPETSLIATFRKPTFTQWAYFSDNENGLTFVGSDNIRGPMHTNDAFRVCGNPAFGTRPREIISAARPGTTGQGWSPDPGCGGGSPSVNPPGSTALPNRGTLRHPVSSIQLPTSNATLLTDTLPDYRYRGRVDLNFRSNGTVRIRGRRINGTPVDWTPALPSNGLIYVTGGSRCGRAYDPDNPYHPDYEGDDKCPVVYVEGTYSRSVTIASEGDIVFEDDFLSTNNAVAGVIANNYVRVYRPIIWPGDNCPGNRASGNRFGLIGGGGPGDITIDAAIMALNNGLTVDNYWCGEGLQHTLTVRGSIIQRTRDYVGSERYRTGYIKDYRYDSRLRFTPPPLFLDPQTTAWETVNVQQEVR